MAINHREFCRQSISTLSEEIKSKRVSPVELVSAYLSCIEATEPLLNSFITLRGESASRDAKESERQILNGNYQGPLHGIPYALKDLFFTEGVRTTSGVRIYDEFTPSYDSTVARKLKQSGAILLGKLNCSPLAMGGGMGVNAYYGDTHNPWDRVMVPGGSSSGSASATSSGEVTFSLGTDTGGSIRIPAAFCGLVGFKPTYGLISRYGVTPLAWSLDHCGPLTRTVLDSALVLNAVSGWDVNDPTSAKIAIQDYSGLVGKPLSKIRIGVPKEYFEINLDDEVKASVLEAITSLERLGASVKEVKWPSFYHGIRIAHLLSIAESSTTHADKIRSLNTAEAVRLLKDLPRIEGGLMVSAYDYLLVQRLRRNFIEESNNLMENVDLLAGPTVPCVAFPLGAKEIKVKNRTMKPADVVATYTRPFNFNGFPAVTVPCGFSKTGLPIGLQLSGRPYEDALVISTAWAYEQAHPWHKKCPIVSNKRGGES